MKHFKLILLFSSVILAYAFPLQAQRNSCCALSTNQQFASMAADNSFIKDHESPLPFSLDKPKGSMIEFKTNDGHPAHAYEVKSLKPSNKFVIMIHEWWGLNDYIKQEAEKLQAALGDVNVIALDMFDGKVTSDPAEASKQTQGLSEERSKAIISGIISYAGPKAKIATIGWCFGGGISLQTAISAEKQCLACVMYYGMPENDLSKLKKLQAPVLGIFGTQDKYINPEVVSKFEANMKSAGKNIQIKNYDAVHAFANPSNPHHDPKATADAYALAVAFIKNKLG